MKVRNILNDRLICAASLILALLLSAPPSAMAAQTTFVFRVVSGNAGVIGVGGQGPFGDNVTFTIDSTTGLTTFADYRHVTYVLAFPDPVGGATIRLRNGSGVYNLATGQFSSLRFDVEVEDKNGNKTSSTHSFSGFTTEPLPVPVGASPPTGAILSVLLSSSFSINLGGGFFGNVAFDAEFVSATDVPTTIQVATDVKPQSCPNPLNVNSQGVLPVAIAGTSAFDVMTIDPASLRIAGVAPLRSNFEDVATPFEPFVGKTTQSDCTNLGADGILDMTLKFETQDVVHAVEAALGRAVVDGESLVLQLTGALSEAAGGTAIEGEDVVVILRKGKR